jgi:sulfate/thiosulfate-binding protein
MGKDKFEIVIPSLSILAEPPVAVVEKVANKHNTLEASREYLSYLYSPEAQEIIGKNYYRPVDPKVAEKYASIFPKVNLVNINDFGGWKKAQKDHFDDGGTFDEIYKR